MKYIFSVILAVSVLGLTFLYKITDMKELFAGGTTYVFFQFTSASIIVKSILATIFIISLLVWLKYRKSKYVVISILVFILWSQSGRTIAFNSQNGQIITGWFFFRADKIEICQKNQDCESILYNQVTFEKMFLWRVKIKNSNKENIIFVGPFIWKDYIDVLENFGIKLK
jgi:hypothetical protein